MNTILRHYNMHFTLREREILSCIANGLSSKQIAGKLSISENTVANHRKNMLRKKGAKNSAELITFIMENNQQESYGNPA